MLYDELFWKLFEKNGSPDAYLYYVKCKQKG